MKSKISSIKIQIYLSLIFAICMLATELSGEVNEEMKQNDSMITDTSITERKVKYLTATNELQEEVEENKRLSACVQIFENGNDLFDEAKLLEAVCSFEQLVQEEPRNYVYYYYLGRAQAVLINIYDSSNRRKEKEESIEKAIEAFEKAIRLNRKFAEAHSYLGVIFGQKIRLRGPMAGILYGGKIKRAHGEALTLDRTNPIVQVNNGINYLHTPQMWGGSMEKAIECFEAAIQLDPNFVDGYVWLGSVYELKDKERAIAIYRKALELNPNSRWARSKLENLTN